MDRRTFLHHAVVGAGVVAGASRPNLLSAVAAQPASRKAAVLRLCSQEWIVPGGSVKEKAEKILKWGGCGLEFGGIDVRRAEAVRKELEGTGIAPAALCWGSCHGDLISTDPQKRKKAVAAFKQVLDAAAALGSTGVIWVPCFNGETKLTPAQIDPRMDDLLGEIGAYAQKIGARSLLEPLNKGETFYVNRLEQAAAICRRFNNPGVCMMGDFYHMAKEEKSDEMAFVTGGAWVHHVHLATGKSRILPGQEPHSYVSGFKGLKRIGYQDFCSLECDVKPTRPSVDANGKTTLLRDPDVEIPKAFAFLKQQWEEARI
ncbi:MAG: sugar phosphate isomerase/epimerase family protein [Thermoguttaceae bacterium]|jgi:sugar phosphate isomerase/epimerase